MSEIEETTEFVQNDSSTVETEETDGGAAATGQEKAEEVEENKTRTQNHKALIKPIGCGANLVWTECPDATAEAEAILNEISMSDYYNNV